ncbi:MAG: TlyA family RNA methyltransferase [Oscillospiraceae bacterium]|nr:TlyA family RNA methyltransferase [Oscillospiraceae bacterium]
MMNRRLDRVIYEMGLADSRTRAGQLIKSGNVRVNGEIITKPSHIAGQDSVIHVEQSSGYVSRGGYKLKEAIDSFGISLDGIVCLDIGASTGGFTDCMLQHGAKKVYAVDVGKDQLALPLRKDRRVVSLEKTDIRNLGADMIEPVSFAAVDLSFISLKSVLPHIVSLLGGESELVALIKPQFEGRHKNKKGVIKDKRIHDSVVAEITEFCRQNGFPVKSIIPSPIKGKEGNTEFLAWIETRSITPSPSC